MTAREKIKRLNSSLLVLAGDTDWNLGDRAIVYGVCKELRKLNRKLKIFIQSGFPARDQQSLGVRTIPRGAKGLPALIRNARRCDAILVGGGGLFQDDDSLVKMPYWALRIAALRAINRGKPIMGYSLGIGPLRKPVSRLFARLAFSCMDVISARDEKGRQQASRLTDKSVHLVPDPALLTSEATNSDALKFLRENRVPVGKLPIIGAAIRSWFHQKGSVIPHKYAVKYGLRAVPGKAERREMIRLLASVFDRLVVANSAYILFMPTYNVAHEADDRICSEIMAQMSSEAKGILRIEEPGTYVAIARHLNVMLGGRMHPAILSAVAGTNIVGLSYNQKFAGFFNLLGLDDMVLPIDDFLKGKKADILYDLIRSQLNKGPDIKARAEHLAARTREFNQKIVMPLLSV